MTTQEDDHRESRRRRRELRKNKVSIPSVTVKPTVKKARVCINCGNWIRKVELNYQGQNWGWGWIHFRARGMSDRKFLWTIERCIAIPRPIPESV